MVVSSKKKEETFKPFTIELLIETEEERAALENIVGRTSVIALLKCSATEAVPYHGIRTRVSTTFLDGIYKALKDNK